MFYINRNVIDNMGMNLNQHYNELYTSSISQIASGKGIFDTLIDSDNDRRRGITLLIRPSLDVKQRITSFLEEMRLIDPDQYYYPESDMHITLLSIISCYDGFDISSICIPDYSELIRKVISQTGRFSIRFKGITASPSCVMIQGFPENDNLNQFRERIRSSFNGSNLSNSIDTRYKLQTAHSTVIRFKNKLTNTQKYLKQLDAYRNHDFGSFEVNSLELVFNDWYQRVENTLPIESFTLGKVK